MASNECFITRGIAGRQVWIVALFLSIGMLTSPTAFAAGRLEQARSRFFGEAQSRYQEIVKYLDAKNFEEAKRSADAFKELLNKINEDFLYIDEAVKVLDPEPKKIWTDFYGSGGPWRDLSINSGGLQLIGKADYGDALSKVKEAYPKCGDQLNNISQLFKEYGKRLDEKYRNMTIISDSWK
jgi:hypothetical protein